MGMSKELYLDEQDDRSGYDMYDRLVHFRSLSERLQKENDDLHIQIEELKVELDMIKDKVKTINLDCNVILQRKLIK